MTTAAVSTHRASASLGRTARLGYGRVIVELRTFYRTPMLVFFTFFLPVMLVVIFSTVFSGEIEGPPGAAPVQFSQYFVAGMLAAGIMSTSFTNLATTISTEQGEGLLKRLEGTPLPKASYFIGKLGVALITSVLQAAIILVLGIAFFRMHAPTSLVKWAVFAWVFVLGVLSCSLLGIAYTRLIRDSASASAIVQPPYLLLQFISGVFFEYSQVPPWLQFIASLFPLRWMAQGFRYVFLPDWVAGHDYGGHWHLDWIALVLVGWLVGATLLSLRYFRWSAEG